MSSTSSQPASLDTALTAGASSEPDHARARHLSGLTPGLSPNILAGAHRLTRSLPALHAMLTGTGQSPLAEPLLADLSRGLQRIESAAFLSSSTRGSPAEGARRSARLRRQVTGLLGAVHIVRPEPPRHAFSYTLASTNSPLPITVDNSSSYRAFVHITVQTVGGVPGLTTNDLGVQSIAPDSKQTFRVPAKVQRSGRYALVATLTTGHGDHVLGPPVRLTVHSTVFGTIGIVITVVAALRALPRPRRALHPPPPAPAAQAARLVRRCARARQDRVMTRAGAPGAGR